MSEMGVAMMGIGAASGPDRASQAAEQAINSPLLEDVDLSGAKGILVNITAGPNLSIGEFDEVGNTVRDFADEDATVVVGTVIDPDMDDQMRVTVVATGLGNNKAAKSARAARGEGLLPMRLVAASNGHDYKSLDNPQNLDLPAANRHNRQAPKKFVDPEEVDAGMDYLDIPAFLRRQAD
jgi:cell division protein FtsZ